MCVHTHTHTHTHALLGIPRWLSGKVSTAGARDAGDAGSVSGWGRPSGGENGSPLRYSGLENPMDRGAWQATVHRVAESDMTEMT